MGLADRFMRNRELRIKVVKPGKDESASIEDILEETPTIDPEKIVEAVKELVTHTAITIFAAAVAFKAFDTICKIVVKKV